MDPHLPSLPPPADQQAVAAPRTSPKVVSLVLRALHRTENAILIVALSAMILLPLLEIVLRKALHLGISGSTAFVQHGSLIVGMIGGAIAARQNRLLALATAQLFPPGRLAVLARLAASAIAVAITAVLFLGSVQFVIEECRQGAILAYGLPVWVLQLALPIGFGLIGLRLLWNAAPRWWGRIVTALLAAGAVGVLLVYTEPPDSLAWLALGLVILATALGAPIFSLLGGVAVVLYWRNADPWSAAAIDHYSLVTNPSLPAIPLFTLAGYFLAEGGASRRLVDVFSALFGRLRGGPAIVTVLACAFFTSFTGASGVTILALGGLLLPILRSQQYSERAALGLVTGAGSLGMLFPPCLPLILYAIVATQALPGVSISIESIFLAGILPGTVLVIATAILGIFMGERRHEAAPPFSFQQSGLALWNAKWELLLPVVALVALFGGFATPVEAAAITALYAFVSQTVLHRDLSLRRDVPRVIVECGLIIGGVLLILGLAKAFTTDLIILAVPDLVLGWIESSIHSPWLFLLLLNLVLLVVGCLMDVYTAIIVVVPLLAPMGAHFGIDPLHLGIIFLANLELGFLTPPVGMNLFLSSYRFNKPVSEVVRAVWPLLLVQFIGVLLITYVPPLTTMLPRWLGR